jgi:hypothetical protein
MLVPLNSPISSTVPANRQVIWAASRIEIAAVSETELSVTRVFLGSAQPAWSLPINVTGDEPHMVVGKHNAIVVADRYLLLKTEAVHWRGTNTHNHMLHHISGDGRLLWSLPLRALDQVGLLDDRLVVVHVRGASDDPVSQPPLEAHLREPVSGHSVVSYPIPVPEHLWSGYQRAQSNAIRALLDHDGEHFVVRVSLLSLSQGAKEAQLANGGLFLHVLPFRQTVVRRWGFVCPDCLRPGSLQITQSIQIPPDSRSDDIVIQVIACNQCDFRGLATYEESRRGAMTAEAWNHAGYRVTQDAFKAMAAAINQCPNPKDAQCACATHQRLGAKDASGRWQGLNASEWTSTFPMRLVQNT